MNWKLELPEDLRESPALKDFDTPTKLAKSFIDTQKMVNDRVKLPKDDSPQEERDAFYKKNGRPDTPPEYSFVKKRDSKDPYRPDAEAYAKKMYELGLNDKQASELFETYVANTNAEVDRLNVEAKSKKDQAIEKLKEQHGDKVDEVIDTAKRAVKGLFGDQLDNDVLAALERSGLANDPRLISKLSEIGKNFKEDKAVIGDNKMTAEKTQEIATKKIAEKKANKDFIKALTDKREVGHDEAVREWAELHKQAEGEANAETLNFSFKG